MQEVKIYGEIVPFQDKWIIDNGYCNLTHVQTQLKEAKGGDVKVRINSFGGDVEEGFAIYHELRRYAKDNKAKVTTLAEGRCASIATVIFLAGDTRIITETTEPFVHNAWCYAMGDAKEIARVQADLEKATEKIAMHYALHTDLSEEEAKELMNAETSITPKECLTIRFATEIEEVTRPKALQRFTKQAKNRNIPMERGENSLIKKLLNILQSKEAIKNKVELTAAGEELNFYELSDGDSPSIGDKANYDGQPANNSYVMNSGITYEFKNGVLINIIEKETESEELKNLKNKYNESLSKISALEEKNKGLQAKVDMFNNIESEVMKMTRDNSSKTNETAQESKTDYKVLMKLRNK